MSGTVIDDNPLPLAGLNAMAEQQAEALFMQVCHCRRWAQDMTKARPFTSKPGLLSAAQEFWRAPSEAEILEAFNGHARIGDITALQQKYSAAAQEQGQVAQASAEVIQQLFDDNNRYFEQNGFIFVVCASGKSADQMLALLQQRLANPRHQELANGAAEQGKITALRLSQRLTSEAGNL